MNLDTATTQKTTNQTSSQIKGSEYEFFIRDFLIEQNFTNKIWLWSDLPEFELKKSGLLQNWNKHRLERKDNKINNQPDVGCDILMKDTEKDEYIVIQCKNFSPENAVTIHHLSGFYVIIATYKKKGIVYYSSKLSYKIKDLQATPEIQYIKKIMENPKVIENKIKLLENPHYFQIEAYEKLKNEKRSILALPCGTGKTLTAMMIGKDYDNIILVSPLIEYSKQNLERFEDELNIFGYKSILINSDATRDKDEILESLIKNKKNILSFTYKSADILMEVLDKIENKIVIIDEFHNLSKNDILGTDEQTYLYKLLKSDSKILFMSATPKFFNIDDFDYENEEIFGKVLYSMTMAKAISEKYITDYEIYIPDISVKNNLDDISKEVTLDNIPKELALKAKFIMRGMLETGSKKCIIYFTNQNDAKNMTITLKALNEYFFIDLYTDYIISDTSPKKRTEILDKFTIFEGYSLICSVNILDECIDIPSCDSIFITYPSDSKIKNIQRLCRANRKNKFNLHKIANIFLWCDEHKNIGNFLANLKEFDDNFTEHKVVIMNYDEKNGGILERNKDSQIQYDNLDDFVISVKKLGYGIDNWKKNLKELKEFIKIHKRRPDTKTIKEEKYLGKWLDYQISIFKKNEGIMKLQEIKNLWDEFKKDHKTYFISNNENWQNKLNIVENFIISNNRLPTTASSEDEETFKLGKWITRNNQEYDKNEKAMKDEETRSIWIEFKNKYANLFYASNIEWNQKINQLKQFITTHGRLPYENQNNQDEYLLRVWTRTQGNNFARNQFQEDTIKIQAYESLVQQYPYLFNTLTDFEKWIENYENIIDYIEENNSLPLEKPKTEDENLKALGVWKSNLIKDMKKKFIIHVEDINPDILSLSEKKKYDTKLKTYNESLKKFNSELIKDNKIDKKVQKSLDNINSKKEKDRFETSEKVKMWNELKNRFPKLFEKYNFI
jgi:superfamily II DNA or RNA helicase